MDPNQCNQEHIASRGEVVFIGREISTGGEGKGLLMIQIPQKPAEIQFLVRTARLETKS